jgi:hypothetical protein
MINYIEIRRGSIARLERQDIPIHPNLPFVDGKLSRSPLEVAKRIIGLYVMLGIARDADPDLLWNWMEDNDFLSFLSEDEMNILKKEAFLDEDINICSWKQESIFVLGWYGNFESCINFPTDESDLTKIFTKIPPEVPFELMLESFQPRSESELIEELDFYYCVHAAIKHPELWKDEQLLGRIKVAAVEERRRALEWLVSTNDWDNVSLDT